MEYLNSMADEIIEMKRSLEVQENLIEEKRKMLRLAIGKWLPESGVLKGTKWMVSNRAIGNYGYSFRTKLRNLPKDYLDMVSHWKLACEYNDGVRAEIDGQRFYLHAHDGDKEAFISFRSGHSIEEVMVVAKKLELKLNLRFLTERMNDLQEQANQIASEKEKYRDLVAS